MARDERLRVLLVAALALGVMGGVVGTALLGRSASSDDPPPTLPTPPTLPAATSGDRAASAHGGREAMPGGCEVDPKAPPAVAIDVPGDRLDLGAHKQGEVVERQVTVRNTGSGVLCIQQVETGCGCVKAEWLGDKHVPPGAAGTVTIRIDTTGREGIQEKAVRLFTNVPDRPVVEFKVHIEVRLGLMVVTAFGSGPPAYLVFGQKPPGRPASATVRLKSPKDEPAWKVLGVESLAPEGERTAFTWQLKALEQSDPEFRSYDLVVTHPGRPATGVFQERLKVTTSHPDRPELVFDSQLHVVTKFYTGPIRASFGFIRPKDPSPAKTIYVMAGEPGEPFRVTGAKVEGKGYLADAPRQTKDGWAVDVRYDGEARAAGRVAATLVITVDDAEMPTLTVPLEGQLMGD